MYGRKTRFLQNPLTGARLLLYGRVTAWGLSVGECSFSSCVNWLSQ